MKNLIKNSVRKTQPFRLLSNYKLKNEILSALNDWDKAGNPIPPPHQYKQQVVIQYAKEHNITTFVETGTYKGDMINAVKYMFNNIISIEVNDELSKKAQMRFDLFDHIKIIHGDSAAQLKQVVNNLNEPTLFWLDGHFSGGITSKGEKNTPIVEELKHILSSNLTGVILIDDARCFNGLNDYPRLENIEKLVHQYNSSISLINSSDIIRIIF